MNIFARTLPCWIKRTYTAEFILGWSLQRTALTVVLYFLHCVMYNFIGWLQLSCKWLCCQMYLLAKPIHPQVLRNTSTTQFKIITGLVSTSLSSHLPGDHFRSQDWDVLISYDCGWKGNLANLSRIITYYVQGLCVSTAWPDRRCICRYILNRFIGPITCAVGKGLKNMRLNVNINIQDLQRIN